MREGDLQPFLVAFPMDDGSQQIMLDPSFFNGPDEVGAFLVELAQHYARGFVQSGHAPNDADALERIREMFDIEWETATAVDEDDA